MAYNALQGLEQVSHSTIQKILLTTSAVTCDYRRTIISTAP